MSVLFTKLSRSRILLAVCLLLVVVFCGAVQSYASKTDLVTIASDAQTRDPTIFLIQGTAEIIDVSGPVADMMVADPSIVDVTALQSNRLYVVGVNLGSTNLIAIDENGDVVKRLNIHVTMDTNSIQETVDRFFPDEGVKIEAVRGQLILSGNVSTPDVAQKIQNLVTHYVLDVEGTDGTPDEYIVNLMSVKSRSQVTLRVKIMEVSRTLLRQRGSDTVIDDLGLNLKGNLNNSGRITDAVGASVFGGVIDTGLANGPFASFGLLESFGAFGPLNTVLDLLEEEGLAKVLAEPNLTAISGELASFLAGGEFPVPSGRDNQGRIEITFREFGVSLNFTPVVLSEDRISLQMQVEVSSLALDQNVQLGADTNIPGLDIRRAATTVELGSGGTLMVAGLLKSETVNGMSGLPGMTRTPIIGQLISSESFQRDETELVVLVTPYLVQPFADRNNAKEEAPMPAREKNYLASAFSKNIRRAYGALKISGLFGDDETYGYILD